MQLHTLHELDQSEGTVQLHKAGSDSDSIVLVPRPSEYDPNDPLRWPTWKKHVAFGSICAFTFLTNYAIGGLAPAFYILSQEFDKTTAETSNLLVWPILVLGIFNFFWVPVANYFGKRPVFVFASLLLTLCYVWGATAQSFDSLLWSNIIAAFAGSSTEAIGASIVNDLYFLHERGAKMGIYMNFISGGNTIGPLLCGFTITGLSWRWHKWIAVALTAIDFIAVVFFVPETTYHRNENASVVSGASTHVAPRQGGLPVYEDEAEKNARALALGNRQHANDASFMSSEDPRLSITSAPRLPRIPRGSALCSSPRSSKLLGLSKNGSQNPSYATSPERGVPEVPKKTYLQELSLWNGVPANMNILKIFLRPWPLIAYSCVVYAFLGYALSLVLTVSINILNPFVLQAPPYNWSPMINGLINIAGFIGNVFGAYAGGWLVDVFSNWRSRKNNGVFEPESRLWLLVLPTLITGAGCLVFGYGVERTLPWISLFFGYGMVSFSLTAVPTIAMTYVSDCLLPVNSDALMLVNGLKNIVAFGFLYGIIPWAMSAGYIKCFGTQAGIFVGIVAIGAVFLIMFGSKIRHAQAHWRIIL